MGAMLSPIALVLALIVCNADSTENIKESLQREITSQLVEGWGMQTSNDSTYLNTGWYYVLGTEGGVTRELDRAKDSYWLDPTPIVTSKNIVKFDLYEAKFDGESTWGLSMQLDSEGTVAWAIATDRSVGRQLALVVNNKLLEVPKVMAEIPSGMTALNRGIYSKKELEEIRKDIESDRKR